MNIDVYSVLPIVTRIPEISLNMLIGITLGDRYGMLRPSLKPKSLHTMAHCQ